MNNDLEQFSEERLKELESLGLNARLDLKPSEGISLIRIALAAKQAKPVGIFNQMVFDVAGSAVVFSNKKAIKAGFCSENGELARNHQPLYTTPQPAHTEQDGCQWNPDENLVYSTGCGNEWQFTEGGIEENEITYCPYCSGKIAASPKPECE
ncbi:hypothetical protein M2403_002020 [Rahnella sp. BIGb0603]|uniref:hypothetical protein n=1 Tax=Rahnella sp. BIGb0603 TaxID=2940612 RepID=UPI002166C38A|nr:hypothetical protein [Rahnella sp. BIGb0603]MCS3423419.1 hypothetical protein [Rahnella sp. BIGb0603]